jgi:hypothetical protein
MTPASELVRHLKDLAQGARVFVDDDSVGFDREELAKRAASLIESQAEEIRRLRRFLDFIEANASHIAKGLQRVVGLDAGEQFTQLEFEQRTARAALNQKE